MMTNAYEEIELFGLTENGTDDLPIPNEDDLEVEVVEKAFEILTALKGTGLASEIEPLAHGIATVFARRAKFLAVKTDDLKVRITALIRAQDGSEVRDVELDTTRREFEIAWEKSDAMAIMAEAAASAYDTLTGKVYIPVTGSRKTERARETGAIFEAKEVLEQHEKEESKRNRVGDGPRIAVTGPGDWTDVDIVFKKLDKLLKKFPDMVLIHKGARGVEKIASEWAKNRKLEQIIFRPNWKAYPKVAGYLTMDEMVRYRPSGLVIFPGTGPVEAFASKADDVGIKVWRIEK